MYFTLLDHINETPFRLVNDDTTDRMLSLIDVSETLVQLTRFRVQTVIGEYTLEETRRQNRRIICVITD